MKSRSDEVNDFFGNNKPDFTSVNPGHAQELSIIINSASHSAYHCYERLFSSDLFIASLNTNYDELARCAGLAFAQEHITREQIATLLELIELKKEIAESHKQKKDFESIKIVNIFDNQNEFTDETKNVLPDFGITPDNQENFKQQLMQKPLSERCYYILEISKTDMDTGTESLINFAAQLKIIKQYPVSMIQRHEFPEARKEANSSSVVTIIALSVGARDALTKTLYGVHAKKLLPCTGIFDIDAINDAMYEGSRLSATPFPGIKSETSFHQITAKPFYLALHDELHRRLISTIPNTAYYALLHAVSMVREKTGKKWSKEIWDCVDMEVDVFKARSSSFYWEPPEKTNPHNIDLYLLLRATVATEQRPGGLFTPSAYNDTMWLLLIDMHLNQDEWKKLSIDSEKVLYNLKYEQYSVFVKNHSADLLKYKTPAEQVAFIKSAWFELPYSDDQEAVFVKKKISDNKNSYYLQVHVKGHPILASKEEFFKINDLNLMSLKDFFSQPTDLQNLYFKYETLNIERSFKHASTDSEITALFETFLQTYNEKSLLAFIQFLTSSQCDFNLFKKIVSHMERLDDLMDALPENSKFIPVKDARIKLFKHIFEPELFEHLIFSDDDTATLQQYIAKHLHHLIDSLNHASKNGSNFSTKESLITLESEITNIKSVLETIKSMNEVEIENIPFGSIFSGLETQLEKTIASVTEKIYLAQSILEIREKYASDHSVRPLSLFTVDSKKAGEEKESINKKQPDSSNPSSK